MKRDEGSNESAGYQKRCLQEKEMGIVRGYRRRCFGIAGLAGYWWFFMRGRVSTDDAYVVAGYRQHQQSHQGHGSNGICGERPVCGERPDPGRTGPAGLPGCGG